MAAEKGTERKNKGLARVILRRIGEWVNSLGGDGGNPPPDHPVSSSAVCRPLDGGG